jgi:ADP-ribosylglycohydrolase
MENKTAVDFLKDKFIMIQWLLVRDEITKEKADEFLNDWSDRAKEVEKEKIKEAYLAGWDALANGKHQYSEDYYNENYGSRTQE